MYTFDPNSTTHKTMSSHLTLRLKAISEVAQSVVNTTNPPVVSFLNTTPALLDLEPLFSKSAKRYLDIFLFGICAFSVSFAGVLTNILNLIVYYKYGLREGMNLSFFALSFSDLAVAVLNVIGLISYSADLMIPTSEIQLKALAYLTMGSPRAMFLGISGFTTGLISIERCVCVARPLKVKAMFTHGRCILILVLIYLFNLAVYMPMHLSAGLEWQLDPNLNKTRLMLKLYFSRRTIEITSDIINGALVSTTIYVTVIASGIVLISALRRSAKFRSTATTTSSGILNVSTVSKMASYRYSEPQIISRPASSLWGESGDDIHQSTHSPACKMKISMDRIKNASSSEYSSNIHNAPSSFSLSQSGLRNKTDNETHLSAVASAGKIRDSILFSVSKENSKNAGEGTLLTDLENQPASTEDINVQLYDRSLISENHACSLNTGNLDTYNEAYSAAQRENNAAYKSNGKGTGGAKRNIGNHRPPGMSRKNAGLVRMVAILVVIHVTCSTPGIVFSFVRLFIQDLDVSTRLEYLHNLLFVIVFIFEGINGSVNLLVYYKASSKYRAILAHMCCSCRGRKLQDEPC